MNSHLPLRSSLHDQLVVILREGIIAARWRDELPSEATLCREFQVSRMTLRKAIAQLERERWITFGGRGYQHSILRKGSAGPKSIGHIIRVLTPFSLGRMGTVQLAALDTLAERIAKESYRLEFEYHPRLFQRHHPADLRRLDALPETAGWLLFFATAPMQRWFASVGRPCVVAGWLHEGVQLSCVYPDTQAEARHAAGRLYARGHREMVYLIAELTSLGDRLASAAFVEEARRLGANARIVEHGPEMESVHRTIARILATRPRPTGFLSCCPEHCLTALYHFLGAGLQVPTDVAIVSGWDDLSLEYTLPTMARYRVDGIKLGRKLASVFLDQLKHGSGKLRTVRILPEFVNGGTLDETEAAKCSLRREIATAGRRGRS